MISMYRRKNSYQRAQNSTGNITPRKERLTKLFINI